MNKRAALASPKRHSFCGWSIKLTREGSPSNDENKEDEENVTASASERLQPRPLQLIMLSNLYTVSAESVTTRCKSVRPVLLVLLVKVIKVRLVRVGFRLIGIKLNGE